MKRNSTIRPIKHQIKQSNFLAALANNFMSFNEEWDANLTMPEAKKMAKSTLEMIVFMMQGSLHPKGYGEFTLPGLLKIIAKKIKAKKMPAIKKGTLVFNPAKGEKVPHPGRKAFVKPATVKVRIRPMKKLKEAALA